MAQVAEDEDIANMAWVDIEYQRVQCQLCQLQVAWHTVYVQCVVRAAAYLVTIGCHAITAVLYFTSCCEVSALCCIEQTLEPTTVRHQGAPERLYLAERSGT